MNAKFKIDLYHVTCITVYSETMDSCKKEAKDKLRIIIEDEIDDWSAGFFFLPSARILLFMFCKAKSLVDLLEFVSHESCHGAFHLLDNIGMKHTMQTDEGFAYLQGFLFRKNIECLQKFKAL